MVDLPTRGFTRNTFGAVADSRNHLRAAFAIKVRYSPDSTSFGDGGCAPGGAFQRTSPNVSAEKRLSVLCANYSAGLLAAYAIRDGLLPRRGRHRHSGQDTAASLTAKLWLMRNSRLQPRLRLSAFVPPRLLEVVRGLRRSVRIGERCHRTPAPGGGIPRLRLPRFADWCGTLISSRVCV